MSLKEHTVKSYDKDLQSVAGTVDEMAHLVLESLDIVAKAIKQHDAEFLDIITAHDYKINSLDFLVEKKMTAMLALRQPMAVDLRYIVSSLKVSSNLERIGDQAKSVIKKIVRTKLEKFEENVEKSFLVMLELSKQMVLDSVRAFNDQDVVLADKVLADDDKIDNIYRKLFAITNKDSFSHDEVDDIINILFMAKSFERLADHSTNIAEIAKYVVTGETK